MSFDSPVEFAIAAAAFIVAIGVLVAVHEFGHFWIARRLGIRVLRFSIGFGKPLWQRTAGQDAVEYVIAAIPLGGYVKLLDEREGNVAPQEAHRAFNRQPVWKRVAVLLGGPVFNLIFAILLYWVMFAAGVPAPKPVVGEIAAGSIAERAGLRFEDEIVAVAGHPVSTLDEAFLYLVDDLVDDGRIALRVRGVDGVARTLTLDAGGRSRELAQPEALLPGLGFDLWRPRVLPVVGDVEKGEAADRAGIRKGDRIVAVDDQPVSDFEQVVKLISPRANETVTVELNRDGERLQLPVAVAEYIAGEQRTGRIGIRSTSEVIPGGRDIADVITVQKFGPLAALSKASATTWDTSVLTLKFIGRIVTGDVSIKAVGGPISIAEITGAAATQDWHQFLKVLALISISLGVFNLLPVPILDGGQIVYQLAELVKGRPVSERALILGQQVGFAMMILLMTLVFYNDIARHF